jgi:uncharacterized protein (TIGR02453 family)
MKYFDREFLCFFEELAQNNNAAWFDENRRRYEKYVKVPFRTFTDLMIDKVRVMEPQIKISAKEAVYRINKDIRFSRDKTPYNTHAAANISKEGRKSKECPGFYFQFGPERVKLLGGAYEVEKDSLRKIRIHIEDYPELLEEALSNDGFKEKFGELQGERNKVLPKEFKALADTYPVIANKQFYFSAELDPEIIFEKDLPDLLMEYYHAGKDVNHFLAEALQ